MAEPVTNSTTAVDVVTYGRAATEALARRIAAAKTGHPLDPVTVVVPSNIAGLSARRLLGSGLLGSPGLANVDFVNPLRLAELVGAGRLGSRRPLTNPVLAAAVRAVLSSEPGMFARVAGHQATQSAVVNLYNELSRAHPDTLAAIATATRRGAEVVRLVGAVRGRLGDYYDEHDLAAAATDRLAGDPSAGAGLGTVVWHLPGRLSPAMTGLVARVLAQAPSSAAVVALTGDAEADAAVLDVCAAVGLTVDPWAGAGTDAVAPEPTRATRIISVSDPDDEVRAVVRELMALAEAGTPLDRIAILHPLPDPYARTVLEQLDGAGIPHNGPSRARLADSTAGRTLLAALALPEGEWGRSDVIALVSGAPLRYDGRPVSNGRWDTLSRLAGVVGGLDDWRTKLAALADRLASDLEEKRSDGETTPGRIAVIEADIEATAGLASFIDTLAGLLGDLDRARSWADRAGAARALLERLLGPAHRRTAWPEHEAEAAERVDGALARLGALDEIEPEPSDDAFALAVAAELDVTTGRVGHFGHGVLIGPLASSVGLDLDAVFVLGMAEGTCPSFRRDDALLPDDDRRRSVAHELATRDDRLADQRRTFLAALAAGGAHRTLLFPRGDLRDRRSRRPSRWLLESAAHLAGHPVYSSELAGLDDAVLSTVASYAAGIGSAPTHGSTGERDVAVLMAHLGAGGDPSSHPLADGELGRGLLCRRSREGEAFTEWDGNLAGHDVPSPTRGVVLSPSRLELWGKCPFAYFLGYVLELGERDDPERIVDIAATDRGSLVHEVLERFVGGALTRPGGPPAPDEPWTDVDRADLSVIAAEVFERYEAEGRTGRPLSWRRTKAEVVADLDEFLRRDNAYRAGAGVTPVRVEMAFGLDDRPALELALPDGRVIAFRGKADRVDAGADGHLVVSDYKTGKSEYKDLDKDPVRAGHTLQLGIYAEAAQAELGAGQVEARYWMATSKGEFKTHGYRWTDDRRRRFLDVVGTIVDGIETGTFPARPGTYDSFFAKHEHCGFCDFDRICPRDRDDHELAKVGAPELQLLDRLELPPDVEADIDTAAGAADAPGATGD